MGIRSISLLIKGLVWFSFRVLTFLFFFCCVHTLFVNSCFFVCVVFLVVADESIGRSVPFVFLERVKDDFMQRYGSIIDDGGSHPLADDEDDDLFEDRFSIAYNLDREFGYV